MQTDVDDHLFKSLFKLAPEISILDFHCLSLRNLLMPGSVLLWILIMWLPFGYQIILAAQDHLSANNTETPVMCCSIYNAPLSYIPELWFGSCNLFQNSWYSQVWCSSGLVDHIFSKFKGLAKIWWLLLCGYSMLQGTTNPIAFIGQSTHSIHHFGCSMYHTLLSMLYHQWE